jgi:hypothetical protein
MKHLVRTLLVMFSAAGFAQDDGLPYVLMQPDLGELKRDFNDAVDQARLVFIVGPT